MDRRLLATTSGALAVLGVSTALASDARPASWEIDTFRLLNDLPDWVFYVIWPFMQYGVFLTIPIAAGIVWWRGRHRLSVAMLTAGVAVYVLAKVVKRVAGRGRPDEFLASVTEREDFGVGSIGYLSGHAAVAATIATLSFPHLRRSGRMATVAVVGVVMVGRIHVGGHFALDVIGGVALGVATGAATMLIARLPDRQGTARRRQLLAPVPTDRRQCRAVGSSSGPKSDDRPDR